MSLFARKIELDVYLSGGQIGLLTSFDSDNLDISFDVSKKKDGSKNEGFIELYNVDTETANVIRQAKPANVVLRAGYKYDSDSLINSIFVGDVAEVKVDRVGSDIRTTLMLTTLSEATRDLASNKSWGGGVTLTEILNYITLFYKISLKQPVRYNKEKVWKRGVTIPNNLDDAMQKILLNTGHRFTEEGGVYDIWTPETEFQGIFVSLSNQTGLVGIPEHISETNNNDVTTQPDVEPDSIGKVNSNNDGYLITSLLNSKLSPSMSIELTSAEIFESKTMLAVEEVRHFGSNFGDEFYTESKSFFRGLR